MSEENTPSPEFVAKVNANSWHDREEFDEVVATIKALSEPPKWTEKGDYAPGSNRWSWSRNISCKYVTVRIDMRDGGFVLCAAGHPGRGERISLDQLKWQYSSEET